MRAEVLVIGGGATGAGVVRDLSMRGVDCVLLEMGDYCHGASGGNHGLLHSGGRYAVKDPASARECASENIILRRIASFCIEDTGGLFVSLHVDDPDFADQFRRACRGSGVPAKEIGAEVALALEPGLNAGLLRCFEVPDGSIDPFALVQGNVDSARENGAAVHNHCQVAKMIVEGSSVSRVEYVDARDGRKQTIVPEVVINAAGSWAPAIASMAGVKLNMTLDQGSMLVADGRLCEKVVNRLRPPSNGDICVPNHTSTIIGTTSRSATSPEAAKVSAQDVELLLREGSALLPSCANARIVRSYCGVRPLLGTGGRNASRTFSVIREEVADNLLNVVGGKLTTYRLMAEKVTDLACTMLGAKGVCRTHLEELSPGAVPEGKGIAAARLHRKYGGRASQISTVDQRIICSCEQVLTSEVEHVLKGPDVMTMADIMRRTRAGMGYCQGLDCSFGILDMMVKERGVDAISTLTDFLAERGRGQGQVSGEQRRQELFRKHLLQGVYGLGGKR